MLVVLFHPLQHQVMFLLVLEQQEIVQLGFLLQSALPPHRLVEINIHILQILMRLQLPQQRITIMVQQQEQALLEFFNLALLVAGQQQEINTHTQDV